ncbi:hypothetical protein H0H93_005115, partial [Arthromyces matolae]
ENVVMLVMQFTSIFITMMATFGAVTALPLEARDGDHDLQVTACANAIRGNSALVPKEMGDEDQRLRLQGLNATAIVDSVHTKVKSQMAAIDTSLSELFTTSENNSRERLIRDILECDKAIRHPVGLAALCLRMSFHH